MTPLDQPVAMITGGNRGIGRGITERLLAEGWAVSIMATSPVETVPMAEYEKLGPVRYLQGSVADLDTHARFVDETLEAWGRIDALVNNAGVAPLERIDMMSATPESYDRVFDINLRGPYFLTQKVANKMVELREAAGRTPGTTPADPVIGTIINITSASTWAISTNRGEYCMSKAGASMATKLWAVRLAGEGIPVYEVRPGIIDTDMTKVVHDKYTNMLANGLAPIARWGQPADVGGAVHLLVSGLMPYATGDIINVDGGMHMPVL